MTRLSPARRAYAASFARRALALLASCAVLTAAGTARAGNRETNPLSNEAALSGGAVAALGRDTGAAYYNPAGLGASTRGQFSLSTQALQFRARVIPNAVIAELPGGLRQGSTLTSIQALLMASSMVLTRHLGRGLTLGAGYFLPDYDYYDYGSGLNGEGPQNTAYGARVQVDGWVFRYHIGPTLAYQPHPRFRLGVSLFFTYEWRREEGRLWIQSESGAGPTAATLSGDIDAKRAAYGGEAVVGFQWEFAKNFHLGLSFRTPRFVAYEWLKGYSLVTATKDAPDRDESGLFQFDDSPLAGRSGRVAPMRVTAGLAYALPRDRGWVSAEMDASPGLRLSRNDVDIRPVANARVGLRVKTAENMWFGLGFFTDHDDGRRKRDFPHFRMNYYGVTAGVELRSPVRLGKGERAKDIVFSTCVAIRYAVGRGAASQVRFDLTEAPEGFLHYTVEEVSPITFHLLAGHLGMGTYF